MVDQIQSPVEKQNEVMIALLARLSIGIDRIRQIVVDKKRDPVAYLRAYNALDGKVGVVQAANLAGVAKGNMSTVLKRWEAEGIIFNTGTANKPLYKHLLVLPEQAEVGGKRNE